MLNNTVFITGASRGIGLSIAQAFASEGHFVIGTSRSKFDLESAFCLLYTSPSPRDVEESRMPSSA